MSGIYTSLTYPVHRVKILLQTQDANPRIMSGVQLLLLSAWEALQATTPYAGGEQCLPPAYSYRLYEPLINKNPLEAWGRAGGMAQGRTVLPVFPTSLTICSVPCASPNPAQPLPCSLSLWLQARCPGTALCTALAGWRVSRAYWHCGGATHLTCCGTCPP